MSSQTFYILIGKLPVPVSYSEHKNWLATNPHKTIVSHDVVGSCEVHTVFTGVEMNRHEFSGSTLFETSIVEAGRLARSLNCYTWEDAEHQHKLALRAVRGEPPAGGGD